MAGILVYEMMHGYAPFYDDNNLKLYQKILTSPIHWRLTTDDQSSRDVRDLVLRLVTRDTTRRLGCMKRGAQDVKDHRYLSISFYVKRYLLF